MTAGAPWSVKGIDPKAREVAKDLARRSGMTLGEWLNRMILEDEGPEEPVPQSYFADRPPPAARDYVETPRASAPPPPRYEVPQHPADEVGRVALALDRLTDRIEASETRTGLAISGVEQSVREALARIEAAEREHVAVAARFEGAVDEARGEQGRLADRLRKLEQDAAAGPRSAEALQALEGALGKVAAHLYEGEDRTRESLAEMQARVAELEAKGEAPAALIEEMVGRLSARLGDAEGRTGEALDALRASFAALDGRLGAVESGAASEVDRRLESMAATLTERLEAARAQIADRLNAAAEGRFDRMEKTLGEMAEHVREAEQRSAQAIEGIGREVLNIAEAMNRRVQTGEQRSAEAIQQVGGEVARIAHSVETRLSRADTVHAEALERLGGEIARITERLSERIANAERRSAQAIDDVGEQVARVSERITHRTDRVSEELSDRIRQSEERTARLLDEARERIDRRLAEAQRRLAETPPVAPLRHAPDSPFATEAHAPFGPPEPAPEPELLAEAPRVAAPVGPLAAAFPAASRVAAPEPAELEPEDLELADGFAPAASVPAELDPQPSSEPLTQVEDAVLAAAAQADVPETPPQAAAEPDRPLSTREVIEQARAAARAAAQPTDGKAKRGAKSTAAAASAGALFTGFGLNRPKRRAGSTLQTALMVVGTAAAVSVGAAGMVLMGSEPGGEPPKRVADALAAMRSGGEVVGPEADTTPMPRAAVALSPQPLGETAPDAEADAAPAADLAGLYASAVRAIEAEEPSGLEDLKRAANLGHAPAQFYLAKLYEGGEAGLKKDLAEARRWTERAAEAGDRKAMHNLALYHFEGLGGAKSAALAAQWFRKAADLGLVDSQYNLGRLYEEGIGVSQNAAEAYKWYLIASRSGDAESRSSADRVRSQLSADAKTVAERAASAFRTAGSAQAVAPAAAPSVAIAQRALSRLGYYQGPTDGTASPALGLAIAAYQRDQGLQATGALDPTTLSRLSVFTR